MVDFKRMVERSRQAKARKCPKCSAEPDKNCTAVGERGEFTANKDAVEAQWKPIEKGTEMTVMHPERYPDYKPKFLKKKTDLEF